jgi:hypothetical protein
MKDANPTCPPLTTSQNMQECVGANASNLRMRNGKFLKPLAQYALQERNCALAML